MKSITSISLIALRFLDFLRFCSKVFGKTGTTSTFFTSGLHKPTNSPARAAEFRLAANAMGAQRKNVANGTCNAVPISKSLMVEHKTMPSIEIATRCMAVAVVPQKYPY